MFLSRMPGPELAGGVAPGDGMCVALRRFPDVEGKPVLVFHLTRGEA